MICKCFKVLFAGLILLTLISSVVFPISSSNLMFWRGDIEISLNNDVYSAGDTLRATISITNAENYSITDGKLVMEIVKGCQEPTYPAQLSDCDNVIYEDVLKRIVIAPLSTEEIVWNFTIPSYFSSGEYRLDVYFIANRAPLKGVHFIFLPGKWVPFKVDSYGSYPLLKILRTKTEFAGMLGQVAPPVKGGDTFNGSVWIEATSPEAIGKKFVLKINICNWDDTECEGYIKMLPFVMDSQLKVLNVSLEAPHKPDAYAIRIEVVDKEGVLHSLYRSRIIVTGVTAKIRKVGIRYPFLRPDKGNEIYVLVGTSPDHYTNPVVRDVKCSVTISTIDGKEIVYRDERTIPELSATTIFVPLNFNVDVDRVWNEFKVCTSLISFSGEIYDSYCFDVRKSDFGYVRNVKYVLRDITYHENLSLLEVDICALSETFEEPVSTIATAQLYSSGGSKISEIEKAVNGCAKFSFSNIRAGGNYELVVYDKKFKKQYIFKIAPKPRSSEMINELEQESNNNDVLKIIVVLSCISVCSVVLYSISHSKR